jgi:tRNA(Ile2) C34 agmatinyltransferase TiaS
MSNDPFGFCAEPECSDEPPSKELPPFKVMTKNLLGTTKDIIASVARGEEMFVEEAVYIDRMNICNGCEFFRRDDKRCTQCGCFMEAKTRFKKTYCPIGKWKNEI